MGEEIFEENLHIACLLSPIGDGGHHALDVTSDTRWDKREALVGPTTPCLGAL